MNNNPFERISRNIHQFEEVIKTDPDVIFLTRKFYAELVHYEPSFLSVTCQIKIHYLA